VVPPDGTIPENLRLGPVVEVWAEPEVIATWLATPPASRTLQRDPLVRAWINFGAARRAWLDEHGYTLRSMPPGLRSGAPHWAAPARRLWPRWRSDQPGRGGSPSGGRCRLVPCGHGPSRVTPRPVDVVVVGAGVAGLSATSALTGAGLRVQCLEARDRVGGRLLSVAADDDGRLDLGASWFWAGEHRVASLVQRLGFKAHAQHLAGDAVYDDAQGVRRLQGNPVDVPAFRYSRGAQALPEALAAALPMGTVRLGSPVVGVLLDPDHGGLRVELDDDSLLAAHVVMAVPPALAVGSIDLPDLDPDVRVLAAQTPVWMGATTKVVVEYGSAFWRDAGLAGSGVSHLGPLRELHDMSGPDSSPAAMFGFAPGAAGTPEVQADDVIAQLVRMFGGKAAYPLQVLVQDWRTQPWTSPPGVEHLGAHQLFGHPRLARPALAGRLHWATTETSVHSPGHVEGALAAAERAVAAIEEAVAGC